MSQLIPYKAQTRMQFTKYGPGVRVSIAQGATEYDVQINTGVSAETSLLADSAPMVTLDFLTAYGIETLPGKTDYKTGFRIILGGPAPANAHANYSMAIKGRT